MIQKADTTASSDPNIERAVLGGVLMGGPNAYAQTQEAGVDSEWFYGPTERKVWDAIHSIMGTRQVIDPLILQSHLESQDDSGAIDFDLYVESLMDAIPTTAHIPIYIAQLKEHWQRRTLLSISMSIRDRLFNRDKVEDIVGATSKTLSNVLANSVPKKSHADMLNDFLEQCREVKESGGTKRIGMSTGLDCLDECIVGLQTGLYLIAARPSMGKTTLVDQIMHHVATTYGPVALATLDMSEARMVRRSLCREAGVSLPKLALGYFTEPQMARCKELAPILGARKIHINDQAYRIDQIIAWATAMVMRHGIKLLAVDHATLVGGDPDQWNQQTRAIVEETSKRLKAFAIKHDIPVILLSQLNRSSAKDWREPELHDLRETGALEQDANVVIMLYKDRDEELSSKNLRAAWAKIAKNQDGELGKISLWLHAPYFLFEECSTQDAEDDDGKPAPHKHSAPRATQAHDHEDSTSAAVPAWLKPTSKDIQLEEQDLGPFG